jgi:hypothetical protein
MSMSEKSSKKLPKGKRQDDGSYLFEYDGFLYHAVKDGGKFKLTSDTEIFNEKFKTYAAVREFIRDRTVPDTEIATNHDAIDLWDCIKAEAIIVKLLKEIGREPKYYELETLDCAGYAGPFGDAVDEETADREYDRFFASNKGIYLVKKHTNK